MYAIIDDRGHQYKVEQGDRLEVELMDLSEGQKTVEFDRAVPQQQEGTMRMIAVGDNIYA